MITLDIPEHGSWQLQEVMNSWSAHVFPQGLTSAPRWIAVRLSSFKFAPSKMQKIRSEMSCHADFP